MKHIFQSRPNWILAMLLVVIAVIVVAVSLTYNGIYNDMEQRHSKTETELEQMTTQYKDIKAELDKITLKLNTSLGDVAKFNQLYSGTTDDLADTKDSLNDRLKELDNAKKEIISKDASIAKLNGEIVLLELNISALEDDLDNLTSVIEDRISDIDDVCDETDESTLSDETKEICELYS